MRLNRRSFGLGAAVLLTPRGVEARTPNPLLRRARRGRSRVYLFGFAEATDLSWLTPKIERAISDSGEFWFETPPAQTAAAAAGAPSSSALPAVFAERGYDRGRDLFQVLPAPLAQRTLAWAEKLGVSRQTLSPMRPWMARSVLQQAFAAAKQKAAAPAAKLVWPEQVVAERARARSLPIKLEYPSVDAVLRAFADLSDEAQPQYLQDMLDYLDDEAAGLNKTNIEWIYGRPDTRFIERMRRRGPALYEAMHGRRNRWWAERIDEMLDRPGGHMVTVGLNHVLGPDSIQACLARRRISTPLI